MWTAHWSTHCYCWCCLKKGLHMVICVIKWVRGLADCRTPGVAAHWCFFFKFCWTRCFELRVSILPFRDELACCVFQRLEWHHTRSMETCWVLSYTWKKSIALLKTQGYQTRLQWVCIAMGSTSESGDRLKVCLGIFSLWYPANLKLNTHPWIIEGTTDQLIGPYQMLISETAEECEVPWF